MQHIHQITARAVFLIGSIFLSLLIAEATLSYLPEGKIRYPNVWHTRGIFQPDSDLIFSMRPDVNRTWETTHFTESVAINSFGLRNSPLEPRSKYDHRIIITGDSMVFGHGVDNTEPFPQIMEQRYEALGRNVDVINAGVKGYGTDQSYSFFLTRLRDLKPSIVLFCIYHNDLLDNIIQPLHDLHDDALVSIPARLNPIYFLGRLRDISPIDLDTSKVYRLLEGSLIRRDPFRVLPRSDFDELLLWSQKKILLQLRNLHSQAMKNEFQLIVVLLPDEQPGQSFFSWLTPLTTEGVRLISLEEEFLQRQGNGISLFLPDDNHYSVDGHQAIADILFKMIDIHNQH